MRSTCLWLRILDELQKWSKRIAVGTLTLILLLFWGAGIEPKLIDERRHGVPIPNLPPAFDGAEIAVIAGFQVGIWGANTETVERIVGASSRCDPWRSLNPSPMRALPLSRCWEVTTTRWT